MTLRTMTVKTKNVPILRDVADFIEGFNTKWNNALWDWLHDGFKLLAFEKWTSEIPSDPALMKKRYGSTDRVKVEREIANLVNQSFWGSPFSGINDISKNGRYYEAGFTQSRLAMVYYRTGYGTI